MIAVGKGSAESMPWRVQWHVTADGTVIQQRSRGEELHQQLFSTFATTRPVTVTELDALSERSEREWRRITPFGVLWWAGWLVYLAGVTLGGGVLLDRLTGDFVPGLLLGFLLASALVPLVFRLLMVVLPKNDVGSVEQVWREAGLTSPTGVTMKAAEARALIAAPGTTSGVETRAKRA